MPKLVLLEPKLVLVLVFVLVLLGDGVGIGIGIGVGVCIGIGIGIGFGVVISMVSDHTSQKYMNYAVSLGIHRRSSIIYKVS